MIEYKATAVSLTSALLYVPFALLQIQATNLDLFGIADKIGVIGILLYMSYTLNNRIEKMFAEFQEQVKEERAKADAVQKELIDKIIELAKK